MEMTKKEEKKFDIEGLLNSLIEKGWKPRNIECKSVKSTDYCLEFYIELQTVGWIMKNERELVSKESGLWQFVCENNLNYSEDDSIYNVWLKHYAEDDHESPYTYASPVWYIIESALCDEDKLESFILDNIKVDE